LTAGPISAAARSEKDANYFENNMTGFARIQDKGGAVTQARCTATRQSEGSRTFDWECQPD